MKIMDIVQPKDTWEYGYAKMAYGVMGVKTYGDKRIPVIKLDDYTDQQITDAWYNGELSWEESMRLRTSLQNNCFHNNKVYFTDINDNYVTCAECGESL